MNPPKPTVHKSANRVGWHVRWRGRYGHPYMAWFSTWRAAQDFAVDTARELGRWRAAR
jgi:hypothetical protein